MTPNQKLLAETKAAFEASKGGNTPGVTEDDRYVMAKQIHALTQAVTPPQPFFCEGSPAMVQLETMVDRVGIRNVLFALSSICDAKAEHLHANWQDHVAARIWEGRAKRCQNCGRHERMIRYRKVGGLHFLSIGRFGLSWFIRRRPCR